MDTDICIDHLAHGRSPLRLAVVTETYPPEVNGVAHTLHQLVKGLVDRGHTVQLVRPRQRTDLPTANESEVLMRGMPLPRYPGLRMGLPCKRKLLQLWSVQRPDVVHIATEGPLGWSALRAATQLRIPVTSDFRTNFHAYSRHYGMGLMVKTILMVLRKFHNATQLTLVPTPDVKQQLDLLGFKRLSIVGRGVDTGVFSDRHRSAVCRARWGADDNTWVWLCVGRLAPEKNWELAVQAFQAVKQQQPNSRLVFVGDGPREAALRRLCPEAWFEGVLTGQALAGVVASCDGMLFPSLTETFGNVVIEGMASGLPVVAFRQAAAADLIVSGEHGHVAEVGDDQGFIKAAVTLSCQPEWARQQGRQAVRRVASRTWSAIAQQMETHWARLLSQAKPAV